MTNQNNNLSNNQIKENKKKPYIRAKKAILCLDLGQYEDGSERIERLTNKIMSYAIKKNLEIIKHFKFDMHKSVISYSNNFYEIIKLIEEQKEPIALLISYEHDLRTVPPIFDKIKELVESRKLELHMYQHSLPEVFVLRDLENLPAQDKEYWDLFVNDTIEYFTYSYNLNVPMPSLNDWMEKIQYYNKFEQSYTKDFERCGGYQASHIPLAKKAILFSDLTYKEIQDYSDVLRRDASRQEKEKYYVDYATTKFIAEG